MRNKTENYKKGLIQVGQALQPGILGPAFFPDQLVIIMPGMYPGIQIMASVQVLQGDIMACSVPAALAVLSVAVQVLYMVDGQASNPGFGAAPFREGVSLPTVPADDSATPAGRIPAGRVQFQFRHSFIQEVLISFLDLGSQPGPVPHIKIPARFPRLGNTRCQHCH
jgi:hypothetical protein